MKITFKKEPRETGIMGVGHPYPNTIIKESKKEVGIIYAPNWKTKDNMWGVSISVKKQITKKEPAPFKWVHLKKRFNTEPEARVFVKENLQNFLEKTKHELYHFE
jgi:hypothetical protein